VAETKVIKKGRELGVLLIQAIAKQLNVKELRVGLLLHPSLLQMGASPDGLSAKYVIEMKC